MLPDLDGTLCPWSRHQIRRGLPSEQTLVRLAARRAVVEQMLAGAGMMGMNARPFRVRVVGIAIGCGFLCVSLAAVSDSSMSHSWRESAPHSIGSIGHIDRYHPSVGETACDKLSGLGGSMGAIFPFDDFRA